MISFPFPFPLRRSALSALLCRDRRCIVGASLPERPQAGREARHLIVGQVLEELRQAGPPSRLHLAEDLAAGRRRADHHHPPIAAAVPALDEAAVFHAADDAGGAGDRDVERVGELAHRHLAVHLELGDDVEVDERQRTERAAMPALDGRDPLPRVPGGELAEQVVGQPVTPLPHRPGALPGVDIQWHMNNLAHRRRRRKP